MTLAIIAAISLLAPANLGVCDKAPSLGFGDVMKGNPVRSFKPNKITVVEFWATWCGPCIAQMPHLSEIYGKYKDRIDLVSVSILENDYSKVKPFVEKMGDKMAYPVVIDRLDAKGQGFMYTNWFKAAGQDGIPVAFIVGKDSKIEWIGHPSALESILTKVIDGTWDAQAYKVKFEAKKKDEAASDRLMKDGYDKISATPRTHSYSQTLDWIDGNRSKYDGPSTQAALDEFGKLFAAFKSGDYDAALKQAETEPTNSLVWSYFRPMLLVARIDALQHLNRTNEWRDLASKAIDGPPDPNILMGVVSAFAHADSKLAVKDAALALKAGEKLASMARVPMFLVQLAWAQYASGQVDKAKATLDEAFSKMPDEKKRNAQFYDGMMANLKEARAYFEKGKS
jgi:thiol-disulfide isomerase/thioredoxin